MYIISCTLDWYRIPHKTAQSLILIIAVSSVSIKITAGKFMDLSLYSFGAVSVSHTSSALTYFICFKCCKNVQIF